MGKAEADDEVEREVLKGIRGYFIEQEETLMIGGKPVTKTVRKWIPGNPGVGMRWLALRRPDVYREKTENVSKLEVDQSFLEFLEHVTREGERERIEQKQFLIDRANAIDVEVT